MKAIASLFLFFALSASVAAAQTPAPQTASPDSHIDTVTVEANKIPLEQAIHNFVKSDAQPTEVAGKIARWSSKMPLCPSATGLLPAFNVFVTERIRTVAGMIGAPLVTKVPCAPNMVVLFTQHPQELLDQIVKDDRDLLGYHDVSQTKQLATMSHPIQALYATDTRDSNGILHSDSALNNPGCGEAQSELELYQPFSQEWMIAFQRFYQYCGGMQVTGSRVNDGLHSEIGTVTVVVDSTKIVGMPLGAISDYIAMLALSQTKAFETCQTLSSITNLMTPNCDTQTAQALTETDIAYLKAIYRTSPDVIGSIQTSEIARQMETQLSGH
jgi:hypothetical protein